MTVSATPTTLERIAPWRDHYRLEMQCQVIHDSIHIRSGWTQEYLLAVDDGPVGYGSIALAGPWSGRPTAYEVYVEPAWRLRLFDLVRALLAASNATEIEVQSNDRLSTVMLHAFAENVITEAVLFEDGVVTSLAVPGATFRQATPEEASDTSIEQLPWRAVIDMEGKVAASGGVLFHYNRPFGDVYMDVDKSFRRRGLGSLMVQELKRLCHERGFIPAARCNPANIASRQTLQKAGFVPCGHILKGPVARDRLG